MLYNTYEPSDDLRDFIKLYWTLQDEAHPDPDIQRIIPDGCMEMIFHYGDHFKQMLGEGNSIVQPKCFVFGQITKTLEIAPTGVTDIFSVRFHPGGFIPFSSYQIKEMENKAVPLNQLFGDEGVLLETTMLQITDIGEKIQKVEEFLLDRLSRPETLDMVTKRSLALILEMNGQLSVDDLSDQLIINRRNLERKFSDKIGLSPKELSRMIRIQSVLSSLISNNYENLTDIAYEFNYFDQAHFIRDFKDFTGLTPKKFFSNNLKMSSLFIE